MAKKGIFDFDTLSPKLKTLLPRIDAAVSLAFQAIEPRAESMMRSQARWTDRTGNARNGLTATHEPEPLVRHTLVMYHRMPYGIWLEVRWSGRYAVIGPTMFEVAPQLTSMVTAAVNRATKG